MANLIPSIDKYGTSTVTSAAGKSFISTVLAKLPFSYQIIDNITALNPKYEIFNDLASNKGTRLQQQAVYTNLMGSDNDGLGSMCVNKNYHQYMYANLDIDKLKRIAEYRRMASYNELANCIDEICDEIIVEDKNKVIVNLNFTEQKYSKNIKDEIQKEWDNFIECYGFKDNGWEIFRSFLIDGEVFFENIISQSEPEYGIIGVMRLPTEIINPVYDNVQNEYVKAFALRRPVINPLTKNIDKEEVVILDKNQVTYINSGLWNEDRTLRLPYIENSRQAYKRLTLVEDSIIIHRLVRAPERLVFNVAVGNSNAPKSESILKKMMQMYWNKKSYDTTTGRVSNVYDAQSTTDSYWFAKRTGSEPTTVTPLDSQTNLGKLEDLLYFQKNLYKSLKIPISRLDSNSSHKDGKDITNEELRFARFLIRIQNQFSKGLKASFITHLKLRKMWDLYMLKSKHINIEFNVPTLFYIMKDQQITELKFNNFNSLSNNEGIANSYAQKHVLGLSDRQMAENREWQRRDAALRYELEQISASGPNWATQAAGTESVVSKINKQVAGGESGVGGGGGASEIPEFGPEPPGEEATPINTPQPNPEATQSSEPTKI